MATTKPSTTHANSTSTKRSAASSKRNTKASSRSTGAKAHKTAQKQSHKPSSTDKHSDNPSSTGHGKAKKEPARQTSRCWPGYEPVPGKPRNEKGSCKPKTHQTAAEKKSDGMAAAASKLHKAGGSKARANHSH